MQATAAAAPVEPAEPKRSPTATAVEAALAALARTLADELFADAALERARAALHRSREQELQAQQHRASFGDIQRAISADIAEQIKRGSVGRVSAKLEKKYDDCKAADQEVANRAGATLVLEREVAKAEQAKKEVKVSVTSLAADVMIARDGAAIVDECQALDRRRVELEELAEGLVNAVSSLAHPLPADVKVRLAAELRKLREALIPPKRSPVPWGLQADRNRRLIEPWMQRFNELTK